MAAPTMRYRDLGRTGMRVSILGYGASSLGGVFGPIDESQGIATVHTALEGGVNYFDVSPYYGRTRAETLLGQALRGVPRKQYYLATKVGQYATGHGIDSVFDYSARRVQQSVAQSMERLGVDYLDVVQCHDIEFADPAQIAEQTLPALHELKDRGLVRHVGLTSLSFRAFANVLERAEPGHVETVLTYNRYTLNDQTLLQWVESFAQRGIGVINASPTGQGLLTERGVPPWHFAGPTIRAGCRKAVEYCKQRGVDIVRLAVRFAVSHPAVATTLIGTARPENMARNIRYALEPVDEQVLAEVLALLEPIRNFNYMRGRPENREPIVGDWQEPTTDR